MSRNENDNENTNKDKDGESEEEERERWLRMSSWAEKYNKQKADKKKISNDILSNIKYFIIIAIIFIVVALIIYFVYRGHMTEEPPSLTEEVMHMIKSN